MTAPARPDLPGEIQAIYDQADSVGERRPGRPTLAKMLGVGEGQVRTALNTLASSDQRPAPLDRPGGLLVTFPDQGPPTEPIARVDAADPAESAGHFRDHGPDRAGDHSAVAPAEAGDQAPEVADQAASEPHRVTSPAGARLLYLASFVSLIVSAGTSWQFFGDVVHVANIAERAVMFGVIELGLIAAAVSMRHSVREYGTPGPAQAFAWTLCAVGGLMAWEVSGPVVGVARVALGPGLGLIALHLALGIERPRGDRTGTLARVARELRERCLSRLGLSNDQRDALARTRDRAARRAAHLALRPTSDRRDRALSKALRAANVAHDPAARRRMLAELAVLRHARGLADLDQPSPWTGQ